MASLRDYPTPIEQLDPFWVRIGRQSALAYRLRRDWLYRRVESIEFVGRSSVRRRVSVDLEMPGCLPSLEDRGSPEGRVVPVSVRAKWPPLMDFNLVGPDGRPASLYVRDTTTALDFGLVVGLAEQTLADAHRSRTGRAPADPRDVELSDDVQELLAMLIADRPRRAALPQLADMLTDELADALQSQDESVAREAAETLDLATQLEDHAVLWVPMEGSPGIDCLVKFSYLDHYEGPKHPWKRLLIACSWGDRKLNMPLPHAGRHSRYHLNVAAPDGLELTRIGMLAFPGARQDTRFRATAARAELKSVDVSQIFDRQGHLYLAYRDRPSHRSYLRLTMTASREGFISACVAAATVIALVLSVTFPWLSDASAHLDSTVVLLAGVPVVLGYVLVRPTAHALERYHLAGVRVMALLSGATPIVGALTLVLTRQGSSAEPDIAVAQPIWAGLVIASWFLVVGLAASWLFATKPMAGDAERRLHPERARDRWTAFIVASGVCVAVGVIAGSLLECQPYAHVGARALRAYLLERRAVMLVAVTLVALGAVALYVVLGGIWRVVTKPQGEAGSRAARADRDAAASSRLRRLWDGARRRFGSWTASKWAELPHERRHRLARLGDHVRAVVLLGPGIAWVWATLAAMSLTAWQVLSVTPSTDVERLAAIARVDDAVANATLGFAVVLVLLTSVWMLARRVFAAPAVALVSVTAAAAVAAILLRAMSVLWLSAVHVSPRVPWIAFAAWVGVVAFAVPGALRRGSPIEAV